MPSLADHQSNKYTKMLIEGDSGTGKSGGLASLVQAGYKLRILDWDNGLEPLKNFVRKNCPELIGNVEYRTLRDKRKATVGGSIIDGKPRAFIDGIQMLNRWKYKDDNGNEIDYGVPAEWGPDVIFVNDSLTFMGDAAFDWREPLVAKGAGGAFDRRAIYFDAQNAIEEFLALVTGDNFETNVIITSHIKYMTRPDGKQKGYPTSVGSALSPEIPRYFNSVMQTVSKANGKRFINTEADALIDLKNSKPFDMKAEYPIETGLAEIFKVLRGSNPVETPQAAKPKALTLKRA